MEENKGCGGINGVTLARFGAELQANLDALANEVTYETYQPHPLLRVDVEKQSGGTRPLSIPVIRDRVLQTAVALVLTPVFEAEFEEISFAYRKGRSVDQAVARIEQLRNQGFRWVVDADIQTFFDEVDHGLLIKQVRKLVTDKAILRLIRQWLKATVVDGNQRFQLSKGVPQGSPISPMLANLYLDQLDEALIDQQFQLVRFADDFVILCKTEHQAKRALQLTSEVLEQLRLCFNQRKTGITHFKRGFRFLGVEFIRSLAIKSKYTPAEDDHLINADAVVPAQPEPVNSGLSEPLTAMQQAFLQANIAPGQFVQADSTLATQPSETDEPEALQPPIVDDGSQTSSYDPRLKTLYLLRHGCVLGKQSERFTIRYRDDVETTVPAIHVDLVMVFGNVQITTQAMQFSLQKQIPIFLLSGAGRYYGVVDTFNTDPVLLHRDQFLHADNSVFCLRLSIAIVRGKLANSRLLLRRFARRLQTSVLPRAADQLSGILRQIDQADNLDQLRGYEGNAARIYFQALSSIMDECWQFSRRNKNPPRDPVNAMLSYGYTVLFYNVYTLLRARGLNPHVGFLHPIRQGHPALVSDVMEEFRSIIVDSVVFNIVMGNKLKPEDFSLPQHPGAPCLLDAAARKTFIRLLENKLNARLQHPRSGLQLDYRRCIEHQINHLVAVIRQTDSEYQPMILR